MLKDTSKIFLRYSFDQKYFYILIILEKMSDVNVSIDRNSFANDGELNEPPHLKKSISYVDLTASLVTQYLDAHPEFLNEYLRKSQIQRRISVLNDKNSGSILEKLRIQTHFNDLNPENVNMNTETDICNKVSFFQIIMTWNLKAYVLTRPQINGLGPQM